MGAGRARARQCAPINTWARGAVRAKLQKGEHGTSLSGPLAGKIGRGVTGPTSGGCEF